MATDTPEVVFNPEPLPPEPGDYWGTERYPNGAVFILPVEIPIVVDGLHLECHCAETTQARPDTHRGRCELIDFAAKHAKTCGFPVSELLTRIGS